MATPPRFFEDSIYYHVYNRGHRKQEIFLQNRDYERFLKRIKEYKKKYQITLVAFCLMPNHFHFLLKQNTLGSISSFMSDLCNSHSRFYNTKYETVGSLFQGRFKAKRVEKDEYLIHLSRYIHLNPLDLFNFGNRQFIENQLIVYPWSSLSRFLSNKADDLVDTTFILNYFRQQDKSADYREFLFSQLHAKFDPAIHNLVFDEI